jgi:nucleotide-binding universal stress UspA family protein
MTMFKRILVPTDGSDITAKAIDTAIALAKSLDAKLYTISVKEPFPYSAISEMQPTPPQEFFDAQERIAAKRVQTVVGAAAAAGVTFECVSTFCVSLPSSSAETPRRASPARRTPLKRCIRGRRSSTTPSASNAICS